MTSLDPFFTTTVSGPISVVSIMHHPQPLYKTSTSVFLKDYSNLNPYSLFISAPTTVLKTGYVDFFFYVDGLTLLLSDGHFFPNLFH